MASLLVVDDDKNIRSHLAQYLRTRGHSVEVAADAPEALRIAGAHAIDVALSDVRMAGMDGMALLRELRQRRPDVIVVLMTAYATVPGAVEAMREGAFHYVVKPFALDEVGLLVERAVELARLRRDNRALRGALEAPAPVESKSPAMRRAIETARQAAGSDATLLLLGESGTGKSLLARAVHAWSARRDGPFVAIPCTTLAEHLLESELFGHVRGAFTRADRTGRSAPLLAANLRRAKRATLDSRTRSSGDAGPPPRRHGRAHVAVRSPPRRPKVRRRSGCAR